MRGNEDGQSERRRRTRLNRRVVFRRGITAGGGEEGRAGRVQVEGQTGAKVSNGMKERDGEREKKSIKRKSHFM